MENRAAPAKGFAELRGRAQHYAAPQRAFTLIELVIVMSIIVLVAGIALPTIGTLLTSGGDAQAYNLLAGQLTIARALAVQKGTYVGVHVQMSDRLDSAGQCYSAVVELDRAGGTSDQNWTNSNRLDDDDKTWTPDQWRGYLVILTGGTGAGPSAYEIAGNTGTRITIFGSWTVDTTTTYVILGFKLAEGYQPQRMPGSMAFGRITPPFLDFSQSPYVADELNNDTKLKAFTRFTILFSPGGQIAEDVEGCAVAFGWDTALFSATGSTPQLDSTQLWERPAPEPGVTTVAMFNYDELPSDGPGRAKYLNENGQFLPINTHTGRLFERK